MDEVDGGSTVVSAVLNASANNNADADTLPDIEEGAASVRTNDSSAGDGNSSSPERQQTVVVVPRSVGIRGYECLGASVLQYFHSFGQ